jgi:hypothetical protein
MGAAIDFPSVLDFSETSGRGRPFLLCTQFKQIEGRSFKYLSSTVLSHDTGFNERPKVRHANRVF